LLQGCSIDSDAANSLSRRTCRSWSAFLEEMARRTINRTLADFFALMCGAEFLLWYE
jgi:hypothetical protein